MPTIRPIRDNILCINADFGDYVSDAGLIIKSNIKESQGITPRWMQVFAVGPDINWLQSGQWVLVEYGRWTESIEMQDDRFDTDDNKMDVWKVDPKGCLAVADEKPNTFNYNSDVIASEKKTL